MPRAYANLNPGLIVIHTRRVVVRGDGCGDCRGDGCGRLSAACLPLLDPDQSAGATVDVVAGRVVADDEPRRVARVRQLAAPASGPRRAGVPRSRLGRRRRGGRAGALAVREYARRVLLVPDAVRRAPAQRYSRVYQNATAFLSWCYYHKTPFTRYNRLYSRLYRVYAA